MNSENTKPVIFLAFANERESEVRYLRNLPEEAKNILQALDFASKEGLCEIVELPNATLKDILDKFQDPSYINRIVIFHYGGHSNGYQLLLESEKGLTTAAYAGGLAAFLGQQDGLQLVFLNGCATQKQAQGLNDAGISIVIATSCDIDDLVAMEFASRFYNGLAAGANIRKAFNEARAAIQTAHGDSTRNLYCAGKRTRDPVEDRWPWDLYLCPGAESAVQWNLPEAADNPLFGLPIVPVQDLPSSPFRYLSWFAREQAEIFFGRGYEIRDLYQQATDCKSEPIILFYGQAGVGKSSVLAAGLLPRLEKSYEILYLRRDFTKGLLGTVLEGLSEKQGMNLAESWLDRERQTGKALVIILDQVEEAFTRPNLDLLHELPDFWDILQAIFGNPNLRPQGKLILGFRKEWLAETEKQLSDQRLPFSRVPLEHLSRRGIIEAVIGTARSERLQQYYGLKVEDGLPEVIADDLLEDHESSVTPTLQILLTKMWEKATEMDKKHPVFDLALYQTLKKNGILLKDFLDQQLVALENWNSEVINSGLVFDVLTFHTTPLGTAEERTKEQLQHTYRHQSKVINPLIQECVDLHLLERLSEAETRLSHDILAPLVRQHFTASDKPGQRARRILESRSLDWQNDQQGTPLDESDLSLVEKGENGMRTWEAAEERLVKASRNKRDKRRRERRILYGVGIIFILTIIFLAAFASYQWYQTEQQKKETLISYLNLQSNVLSKDLTLDKSILLAIESFRIHRTLAADQLIHQELLLLPNKVKLLNHNGLVHNVIFSPNGKYLATASDDNTSRLWDAVTGEEIFVMNHSDRVYDAVFSPDGKYVATTCWDNKAHLWDVSTGKEIYVLNHNDSVINLVFSPDGKYIGTTTYNSTAHLWDLSTGKEIVIPNHDGPVNSVVFSPDGKYLATTTSFNNKKITLYLLSSSMCTEIYVMNHDDPVDSVVFSPDRKYLATKTSFDITRNNNTAHLWDISTGKEIYILKHDGWISKIVFSPDGKYLATVTDNTVHLWDVSTGKEISILNHDDFWVSYVIFSPDGKYLATTTSQDNSFIWDVSTGKEIFTLKNERVSDFSPDGKFVATTSGNIARLWDVSTGKKIYVLNQDGWVGNVVFSPDGKYLATISDNIALLWDVSETSVLKHNDVVTDVAFSPDGKLFATASTDNTSRLWNVSAGKEIFVLSHRTQVNHVVFSPDGKYLATASENTAYVWNASTGNEIYILKHDDWITNIVFSPDGKYLATASENTACVWNASTGKEIYVLKHDANVNSINYSPDGKYLATASYDKSARLWDASTGKQIFALNHDDSVNDVVFSPDGRYLATASYDKSARLWDASTGNQIFALNHDYPVDKIIFSPDGKYLATASYLKAHLWDASTGKEIYVLDHSEGVHDLAFSPDGKYVATACWDNKAHLWDVSTGKEIYALNHDNQVENVAFSPDGKYVATASFDCTARLWLYDTEDLINETSNRLTRNLNLEEWKEYMGDEPYHKTFLNLL